MEEKWLSHWQKVAIFCFAIAVVVAVNVFSGKGILPAKPSVSVVREGAPPGKKNPPPEGQSCSTKPAINISPQGSPQAKVKIRAFVQSSNPCHEPTIKIVKAIARALPERLYAEFVDTSTEEGNRKSAALGLDCAAALVINGKTEFEIANNGKKQKIAFNHGPVHMMPLEFLTKALGGELQKQYGKAFTPAELNKLSRAIKTAVSHEGESHHEPSPKRPKIPHPAL